MLEQLFGSKTRVKLLRTFLREPDKFFFVRELTRACGVQINAVRRELQALQGIDLVREVSTEEAQAHTTDTDPKKKYFCLNQSCVVYGELRALLIKAQVLGEQALSQELVKSGEDVRYVVLAGIFFDDAEAPTDILVVGNFDERRLVRVIKRSENELGFPIRYTFMTTSEFLDRRALMDKFIYSLLERRHITAIDKLRRPV